MGFPDFLLPGAQAEVPAVTEHCMTTYQSAETRRAFMCAFSKMVVKKDGRMRVYACTLVDDDPAYDLGGTLDGKPAETRHLAASPLLQLFRLRLFVQ